MTVATLPAATAVTRTGVVTSGALATAATADDQFANNGKQYLLVHNGNGSAVNFTFITPSNRAPTDAGGALAVADPVVNVAAGATTIIGPFRPSIFNNASGFVEYNLDTVTTVTVTVLQFNNEAANA